MKLHSRKEKHARRIWKRKKKHTHVPSLLLTNMHSHSNIHLYWMLHSHRWVENSLLQPGSWKWLRILHYFTYFRTKKKRKQKQKQNMNKALQQPTQRSMNKGEWRRKSHWKENKRHLTENKSKDKNCKFLKN